MFEDRDYNGEEISLHEMFETAQEAIHNSEANQRNSTALRAELEAYIDSAVDLKGSDGEILIRIPANFNTIVSSMNRDDLSNNGAEEKPWSQYLLLDGLNVEDDKEYNGRYTHTFRDTPDAKIKRGLAQIQLLDRQLQEASKKNTTMNDEESVVDETFLTNNQKREGEINTIRRKETSKRGSPSKVAGEKMGKYDAVKERERDRLNWLLTGDVAATPNGGIEPYWDPVLENENRLLDAKLAQFGREELLCCEFGPHEEDDGPARAASAVQEESTQSDYRGERRPDYLDELRIARAEKERMARLDALIDACSNYPIEYAALLPPAGPPMYSANVKPMRSSGGDGAVTPPASGHSLGQSQSLGQGRQLAPHSSSSSSAGHELLLPSPAHVQPERTVTYSDIQQLVALLGGAVDPVCPDVPRSENDDSSGSSSPTNPSARSLQLRPVDKEGIRALVGQYKRDIEALARARAGIHQPLQRGTEDEAGADQIEQTAAGNTATSRKSYSAGRRDTKGGDDTEVEGAFAGWLDAAEEVPLTALNMAHPALSGTSRQPSHALRDAGQSPRGVDSGAGAAASIGSGGSGGGRLPPIPPSAPAPAHASGTCIDRDDAVHWWPSKRHSALSAEGDTEEYIPTTDPAVASFQPTCSVTTLRQDQSADTEISPLKGAKSLRLPRSVLNAQLPSSGNLSSTNTTVFRAVNARLQHQAVAELDQQAANGARLAKRIGATLAAAAANNTAAATTLGGGAGTSHRPHSERAHHTNTVHQHYHHQQQQVSPNSARRALRARNILGSVPNSGDSDNRRTDSVRI